MKECFIGIQMQKLVHLSHRYRHFTALLKMLPVHSVTPSLLLKSIQLSDFFFVVIDEFFHKMIGRLKWMPLLVLSSKLCPAGIEGTFFALLMSIDHVGMLTSSWIGGLLLHILNITRTQFDNLWMAILIRSFLRILPVGLLFLVPASDSDASILPDEMLTTKKTAVDSENMELTSLVNSI